MATKSDDLRERVLAYVQHQVGKGPQGIRDAVQKGHDQLLSQIDGLSEEQAAYKPAPDDWCVLEVLQHVLESKEIITRRCFALARGETVPVVGTIGSVEGEVPGSLAQARSALGAAHADALRFADSLAPETNLLDKEPHPWFGPLNCVEWAVFQRVHDGDHANQIQQITSATGYPA